MSLTVVFSLVASLAVALFFIPMLASRQIRIAGSGGAGSTIGDMFNSELLQFNSLARLKALAGDRSPKRLPALALRGLVYVLWLVFEFTWRTLWVVLAILIVVLKAALVILGPILYYPFAALVLKIRKKPAHAWKGLCVWSENPTPFGSRIVHAIWHDLLVFNAPVPLGEGFAGCFRWTWSATRRTCKWPMRRGGLSVVPRFPAAGAGRSASVLTLRARSRLRRRAIPHIPVVVPARQTADPASDDYLSTRVDGRVPAGSRRGSAAYARHTCL